MDKLRLVLVGVEGPVNLGMIARLSDNFDVNELYLVNPKANLEEAKRYAVHAAYRLDTATIVESLEQAISDVRLSICTSAKTSQTSILREPITPWEAAEIAAATPGTVAIVMGRESVGLTRSELARCGLLATIPASSRYPVLNLANATAIMLYEFYKARRGGPASGEPVSSDDLRLLSAYARALAESTISDNRKLWEAAVSLERIALKSPTRRREIKLVIYLLAKACRRIEGCEEKVSRYLQPGA